MKRAAILPVLTLGLILAGCAGVPAAEPAGAIYDIAEERSRADEAAPRVFVMERDGSTIAVFGTTHLVPARMNWMSPQTEAALRQAEVILTETSIVRRGEVEISPGQQAALAPLTMQPEGRSLWTEAARRLGAGARDVQAALRANGLNPADYDGLRPWVVCRDLQIPPKLRTNLTAEDRILIAELATAYGPPDIAAPDLKIELYGHSNGLTTLFLESEYARARNFAALSDADALDCAGRMAARVLKRSGGRSLAAAYGDLLSLWIGGDVERAREMVRRDQSAISPAWAARFLDAREAAWLPQIEAECADTGRHCFIAVGMAHLGGEAGLLRGIERMGYRLVAPQG